MDRRHAEGACDWRGGCWRGGEGGRVSLTGCDGGVLEGVRIGIRIGEGCMARLDLEVYT